MRTLVFVALAASGLVAQQRPLNDISPGNASYQDAKISPDGSTVAYRTSGGILVCDRLGRFETTLVGPSALGPFLWSPDSQTIYAVNGSDIVAAPRNGSSVTVIARNVPGQSVTLWDVDSSGSNLYGTRYEPANTTTHIFELATSGSSALTDVFSNQAAIADVCVDPTDSYLGFTQTGFAPFSPITIWRADIDGQNPLDMLGSQVNGTVEGVDWIDSGDTMVLTAPDGGGRPQIQQLSRVAQQFIPLTSFSTHKGSRLSADGRFVLFEAIDGQGNGPGLMSVDGGGLVYLFGRTRFTWSGPPSMDANGDSVVFSAQRQGVDPQPRLFRLDLDDEMMVAPRAAIGSPFSFSLPVPPAEFGVIFLGQRSPPFLLNGINFEFDLGPGFAILLLAPSNNGSVGITLPLPADATLQGLRIGYQGLRADPVAQTGEFTRSGVLTIF